MAFGTVDVILALVIAVALYYAFSILSGGSSNSQTGAVKKPAALTKSATAAATSGASADERPKMTFLFGSQSGTAENYAYDMAEEGKHMGFDTKVWDLEEYEKADLPQEQFVVVIAATFGEGEPTDNAKEFWAYMTAGEDGRDPDALPGVVYTVFALGNRQYRHFCAVGKRIDEEFHKMGAERLLPCGLGDDDGTLEEDFEEWRSRFWPAARGRFLKGSAEEKTDATSFAPVLEFAFHPRGGDVASKYEGGLPKVARFFNDPTKDHRTAIVPVVEARELRKDTSDGGSTAHIELSLEAESKISYRTADNLGIHPRNDYKMAGRLAARLDVSLDAVFTVKTRGNRKLTMPEQCSVGDLFLYFADINSVVRSKFAAILSAYTKDPKEQQKLLYFGTDVKGRDEFAALKYNWLELLEAFPGVTVPFGHLAEMIPRLQHRFYTISSSSKVHPRRVAATVSRFVKDKPDGRTHVGVCSDMVCKTVDPKSNSSSSAAASSNSVSATNNKMVVFVRPSTFRLPVKAGTPIIMIGPGTGIAPFRGFIQEFRTRTGEYAFGETSLYFGCQRADKDFIYKEELEAAVKDGVLTNLYVAFSREAGQPKTYVQHMLAKNGAKTWALVDKGAYVFVCGGTGMGKDVLNTLVEICIAQGGMTKAAAETYVDRMIRNKRYVQELWSS